MVFSEPLEFDIPKWLKKLRSILGIAWDTKTGGLGIAWDTKKGGLELETK